MGITAKPPSLRLKTCSVSLLLAAAPFNTTAEPGPLAKLPDLAVIESAHSAKHFHLTIGNQGGGDAASTKVRIVINGHLHDLVLPPLNSGESTSLTVESAHTTAVEFSQVIFIDPGNTVQEQNEGNNIVD